MSKPAVLLISRNLPPLKGGIERLMQHAVEELAREYDCDVIGPSGCRSHLPWARHVRELPPGLPWFHLRAMGLVLRNRDYDLVVASNGLMAPLAALAAKRNHCRYAVFVHGLDLIVDNAVYQRLFLPWIRRADVITANSRYTAELAGQRGVLAERVHVVNPGVEVPQVLNDGAGFRAKHGLGSRPILLSVGRLVPRKGIAEFVECSLPAIAAEFPDVVLVLIGEEPRHAATRTGGTRTAIEMAAERAGVRPSVLQLGSVSDDELAQAYAAAEVFVFPVRDLAGDVEGFGMVALEAAAHGVPTVAFDVGGIGDAVSESSGILLCPGDYRAFAQAITQVLRKGTGVNAETCRRHAVARQWRDFGKRFIAAIECGQIPSGSVSPSGD